MAFDHMHLYRFSWEQKVLLLFSGFGGEPTVVFHSYTQNWGAPLIWWDSKLHWRP